MGQLCFSFCVIKFGIFMILEREERRIAMFNELHL